MDLQNLIPDSDELFLQEEDSSWQHHYLQRLKAHCYSSGREQYKTVQAILHVMNIDSFSNECQSVKGQVLPDCRQEMVALQMELQR